MFIAKIKRSRPINFLRRYIPGVFVVYHFLISFLGAIFFKFPSRKIFVIGVTGTKGKTTALELLNKILEEAGKKTALISSLYFKIDDQIQKNLTDNTMPGRFFIQNFLAKAVRAECGYALVEVTSQGIVLSRHKFIKWGMAAITNLAPEHIEAHGSFEKYRESKLKFLKYAAKHKGKIFLNSDDRSADFFSGEMAGADLVLYSKEDRLAADFISKIPMDGIDKNRNLLFEEFNHENVALAASIARSLGISDQTILAALRKFKGLPGRLDFVQEEPFLVVVDYAHTPDSLKKIYELMSRHIISGGGARQRMICVLGSAGGGRDKWKRSEMGKIAGEYCDEIILTNEDPHDENPSQIISSIKAGVIDPTKRDRALEILDRRAAIQEAISNARAGDAVVITGKGSEPYIHVAGGKKIPWSDRDVAQEILDKQKPRN